MDARFEALLFMSDLSLCCRTETEARTRTPAWTQPAGGRLARLRARLPVFEAEFLELRAQVVDVEAELAFCEAGADGVFFFDARFAPGYDDGAALSHVDRD